LGSYHKINLQGEEGIAKVYGVEKSRITGRENERKVLFLKISFNYRLHPEKIETWLKVDWDNKGKERLSQVISNLYLSNYFYQKLKENPDLATDLPTFQQLLKQKGVSLLKEYGEKIRTDYKAASEIMTHSSGLYNKFMEDFTDIVKEGRDPNELSRGFFETIRRAHLEESFGVQISGIKIKLAQEAIGIYYDRIRKLRQAEAKRKEKEKNEE